MGMATTDVGVHCLIPLLPGRGHPGALVPQDRGANFAVPR